MDLSPSLPRQPDLKGPQDRSATLTLPHLMLVLVVAEMVLPLTSSSPILTARFRPGTQARRHSFKQRLRGRSIPVSPSTRRGPRATPRTTPGPARTMSSTDPLRSDPLVPQHPDLPAALFVSM